MLDVQKQKNLNDCLWATGRPGDRATRRPGDRATGRQACSEQDEDEAAMYLNGTLPDEDQPAEIQPEMHFCADAVSGGEVDEVHVIQKVYDKLAALRDAVVAGAEEDAAAARPPRTRIRSLQAAVKALISPQVVDGIERADASASSRGTTRALPCDTYALHTG